MSIFVDRNTKVIVQGITGSQGRFYALRNRDYGTKVVGGVNPKKAGTDVDGIPVFGSVAEAKAETGATVSMVLVPAPSTRAPRLLRKSARVVTSGSIAEFWMTVMPSARTAAVMRCCVAPAPPSRSDASLIASGWGSVARCSSRGITTCTTMRNWG